MSSSRINSTVPSFAAPDVQRADEATAATSTRPAASEAPQLPQDVDGVDPVEARSYLSLGDIASDAYLMGWTRGAWTAADGSPAEVAERVVADLEERWPIQEIRKYLDSLGPAQAQA